MVKKGGREKERVREREREKERERERENERTNENETSVTMDMNCVHVFLHYFIEPKGVILDGTSSTRFLIFGPQIRRLNGSNTASSER